MTSAPWLAAGVAFSASLASSVILLPLLARVARHDEANDRSSHTTPTLRGGGLMVIAGLVVGWVLFLPANRSIVVMCTMILCFGALGFVDDVHPLEAKPRLLTQMLLASAGAAWYAEVGPNGAVRVLFVLAAAVFIVGYVNAFNFMDGINGISGLNAGIGAASFAVVSQIVNDRTTSTTLFCAVIAGASLGFLPLNARPRPLVFLGDVGSYVLGAALASSALLVWRQGATLEASLAPLALYIADTVYTVIDRRRRGLNVLAAHREHVYQRLTPPQTSHAPAALLTGALTMLICALSLLTLDAGTLARLAVIATTAMLLVGYLLLPRTSVGARFTARVPA